MQYPSLHSHSGLKSRVLLLVLSVSWVPLFVEGVTQKQATQRCAGQIIPTIVQKICTLFTPFSLLPVHGPFRRVNKTVDK